MSILATYEGPPAVVFLGVSTGGSTVHQVFPAWAPLLAPGSVLRGFDVPEDAEPARFREVVADMAANPAIRGAVVTSHKLRLYRACADQFEVGDPLVRLTREINCVDFSGRPRAYARDPLSLAAVLDPATGTGPIVCIGAGGSATALLLAVCLDVRAPMAEGPRLANDLRHLTIVGKTTQSLREVNGVRRRCGIPADAVTLVHAPDSAAAARVVANAPAGAVIVNATGLGKSGPGSPLPAGAVFPPDAIAWDFNYRGPLTFLAQAAAAGIDRVDGWDYFVAGWCGALAAITAMAFTPELLSLARSAAKPFAAVDRRP